MNLTDIITEAASDFRDTNHDVVSTDQWCNYVNKAMRTIAGRTPFWPWNESATSTITLAANQRSADLPTDSYAVDWAYNEHDAIPLYPESDRGGQWHGGRQISTSTGSPRSYKVRGIATLGTTTHGCIDFYPLPDGAYTITIEAVRYAIRLDTVTNCIPPFPTIFHTLLVDGAVALAYLDDNNLQQYQARWAAFLVSVKELEVALMQARQETNVGIPDTFWM